MSRIYLVEFVLDPDDPDADRYIAYGEDRDSMPVYLLSYSGSKHYTTKLRFPSALKFFPYADGSEIQRVDREVIAERYGPKINATGPDPTLCNSR